MVGRADRALLDRMAGYFVREGYAATVQDGVVKFWREGIRGAAWVVSEDAGLNEIVSSIMGATEYAAERGVSYVVLPAHLSRRIDESHFWTFGVGLLTYDQYGIKELLHPRGRRGGSEKREEQVGGGEVERLHAELRALADRVAKLEEEVERVRGLEELESRILRLERIVRGLQQPAERLVEAAPMAQEAPVRPVLEAVTRKSKSDQLPSFLIDNPWIEVLAQRG
jgi:hypothetical protein